MIQTSDGFYSETFSKQEEVEQTLERTICDELFLN
jgi:hypothetical protein